MVNNRSKCSRNLLADFNEAEEQELNQSDQEVTQPENQEEPGKTETDQSTKNNNYWEPWEVCRQLLQAHQRNQSSANSWESRKSSNPSENQASEYSDPWDNQSGKSSNPWEYQSSKSAEGETNQKNSPWIPWDVHSMKINENSFLQRVNHENKSWPRTPAISYLHHMTYDRRVLEDTGDFMKFYGVTSPKKSAEKLPENHTLFKPKNTPIKDIPWSTWDLDDFKVGLSN